MVESQVSVLQPMLTLTPEAAALGIRRGLANDLPVVTTPSSMYFLGSILRGLTDQNRDTIARIGLVKDMAYLGGAGGPAAESGAGADGRKRRGSRSGTKAD